MSHKDPIQREIDAVLATAALVPFAEQHAATAANIPENTDPDALAVRDLTHQIALICERRGWPGFSSVIVKVTEERVGVYGFTHVNTHDKDQRSLILSAHDEGVALVLAARIIHESQGT